MNYQAKRTDQDYLSHEGWLDGRDEEIRSRETKIVTTRKSHDCFSVAPKAFGKLHLIPVGERAMCEHAIVDGIWASSYTCLRCMDKYLDEENL